MGFSSHVDQTDKQFVQQALSTAGVSGFVSQAVSFRYYIELETCESNTARIKIFFPNQFHSDIIVFT